MDATTPQHDEFGDVAHANSGNFLEIFNFLPFGADADDIVTALFPNAGKFVSLTTTLRACAMQPVGALALWLPQCAEPANELQPT